MSHSLLSKFPKGCITFANYCVNSVFYELSGASNSSSLFNTRGKKIKTSSSLISSNSKNTSMEHIYEEEWNSLNGMCSEEAEFMAQLLGNCSIPNEVPNGSNFQVSSSVWPNGIDEKAIYSSEETNTSMYSFSQGSSTYSGGSFFHIPSHESFPHQVFSNNNNNNVMDHGDDFLNQFVSNDSMESDKNISEDVLRGSKKRSRIPREVEKNKRSMKMKKCLKIEDSNDEDNNNNDNRKSLSNYCSEDDSNGKTRASRGSATDPQSLYARKRRERINERLRILQKLVPNGTKVDISTMLEEAVQYVKFLQLQIKLLSSDDLWMYAPIAYNGMDIGVLELKANIPKPES